MNHCKSLVLFLGAAGLVIAPLQSRGAEGEEKVKFVEGPAKAALGSVGQIDVPTGYIFIKGEDYRSLLKAQGEPVSGRELGCLTPTNEHWSVVFDFSETGYIKDDEKDQLNADKLLASIRSGTEAANQERARAGHPPIQVVGWDIAPRYDESTHNLEWAVRGAVEDRQIINYNTRLLGRRGVMKVLLIVDPEKMNETLPTYRKLLAGYSYRTGQSYAEYRPGDKVAKYGLGALVAGGAAVGAAKLGLFTTLAVLFKKLWKVLVVALVAVAGAIRKIFTGRRPRQQ